MTVEPIDESAIELRSLCQHACIIITTTYFSILDLPRSLNLHYLMQTKFPGGPKQTKG